MKIIQIIIILLTIVYLFSCTNPYEGEGGWQEDWIATINSTGDSLNYIIKERAENVQFTPDDTKIIVNREEKGIWSMNLDGTDYKALTDSLLVHSALPSICTDSLGFIKITFAAYSIEESTSDIYIMNIDGNNLINITNTPDVRDGYPHFSPDSDSIVYATYSDSLITISIIDKDGENSRIIISNTPSTKLYQRYYYPRFNISGDKIYYKFLGEKRGLYSVNIDDSTTNTLLFAGSLETYFLSMPYDGSKIVFSCNSHIYIMNNNGSGIMDLGYGRSAMISSNGLKIVFNGIGIMNIDGSNIIEPEKGSNPVFSSNGDKIVFNAVRTFPED